MREQLQLVIDFFRHVHPLPSFSFLGEVPVAQRCLDQTLNKTLLLSLCAVTALELRYAKYHPVFTRSWIKQAEETIWEQVDQPSFFHTQALLLIMHYHIGTGDFQRAFMLSALAIRGASAMRLQYERTDLSPMAQEVRRRLMWCMTSLDGRFSMGLPECEMCPYESIYLDLPCPEEEFNADHHDHSHPAPEPLDGVREGGLLAMILRQQFIRRDAVRLKRQLSTATQPAPQVEGVVANLSRALTDIRIPQYNVAELQKYAKSRWLVRYLCAQLSWRQCWLDVYRTFLLGYPEAAPRVITSAFSPAYIERATRLCLHHARANVQILADLASLHTHTMSVVSFDIAVCGYHAARIVMFISRSNAIAPSSNVTPEAASTMATQIRRLIQRLLPDSPMVEKLCVNLDAIIKLHDAGESESAQKDSDIEDEEVNQRPNKRAPRFAVSAKQHQRLGVHSILRQTRFVDDSYDVDAESSARHTSRSPFSARHAMPEHQQQELLTAAAPEQTILQSAPILQATDAPPGPGSLHVGNSPAMEAQFPFATDSLVSDAVSSWIDAFCQSNDFGINSDDNFF